MKTIILLMGLASCSWPVFAQNPVPTPEIQIKLALLAAPPDKKPGATVFGYSPQKEMILLRKGNGELICISDDPEQAGFSVACYHRDLQDFMQRGRELRKQGKKQQEVFDLREKEVQEGKLMMPTAPAALYVYSADQADYNPKTGEVKKGYLRSVVYIPYATEKSTGLPLKPQAPGMPWIMHPGTHGAHIMINPN